MITNDESKEFEVETEDERNWEVVEHENVRKIYNLLFDSQIYESPINLHIAHVIPITLPPLLWHHMDLPPKKAKLSNTGHTVILSAKWLQERPYISGGPLVGNYVFSQLHYHWGANNMEGSEHSIEGVRCILEMHSVFFKSCYLTQESALKRKDGLAVVVHMFNIQDEPNHAIQLLIEEMDAIKNANTSVRLRSYPLEVFVKVFQNDFFLYIGSVNTASCLHYVMWMIGRRPLGVSIGQLEYFRALVDQNNLPLKRNFREVQPLQGRQVYHVNPSGQKHSTLTIMDKTSDGTRLQQDVNKYPKSSREYQNPIGTTIYRMEIARNPNIFENFQQDNVEENVSNEEKTVPSSETSDDEFEKLGNNSSSDENSSSTS